MAKSPLASELDQIQASLHPLLAGRGFRKRGRTYNHTTDDGLVQVINFQMGPSDPPGPTYIPGLRENLYGLFTVNLGIFVPEVAKYHVGGEPKSTVREHNCCLRARLGELSGSDDIWWKISAELAVISNVQLLLETVGFQFLDRFPSRDRVLKELQNTSGERILSASSPSRIIMAVILATRGDATSAHSLLSQQAHATAHAGHREYLRTLATRLGLPEIAG